MSPMVFKAAGLTVTFCKVEMVTVGARNTQRQQLCHAVYEVAGPNRY